MSEVIDKRIHDDARTTSATYLGWPRNRIFRDVIGGGQADFDSGVGHLTPDDRALLYAKYNQIRHLDELSHAFRRLLGDSEKIHRPTLIDVGCGPFTAGLSFAECFGVHGPFRYYGVDRARSMLRLGCSLAQEAKDRDAMHPQTSLLFEQNLGGLDFGPARGEWTIVVASYLLASPTVDARALVSDIVVALQRVGPGPVAVLYTNSANEFADAKYPEFRDAFVEAGFQVEADATELFTDTSKEPKPIHYALLCRPERTTILV
ncbi:hypothetical protein M0D68_19955 [Paraburkholderia sp. SEWSISQ10-3 4]|uniref:hypothetical protein n=1 Tax=Paraburkholderia TaxID=1822464 RepID=UPI0022523354|nr:MULTISPECIES: hypothetical protein [Paraburkholderia]MCX4140483.1 hypothetical protein [Paraburkholderia aspalathi]MDN7173168.1 hypothetical protein [Paraburkholderia sp. SEWSISQ10-3 4]MDQ6502809.1 hypothetical protein [Paraburkholderia aspalathi]